LQDSHDLVGFCPFIQTERRAARRSPGFEMFRLYTRLATIRLAIRGGGERPLSASEIARAAENFGVQKKMSYAWLRKRLDLDDQISFADIPRAEESKRDFVARAGAAAEGTAALREAVGDAGWRSLQAMPAVLDDIAAILTFRSDLGSIKTAIEALPIEKLVADALIEAAEAYFRDGGPRLAAPPGRRAELRRCLP
jgi:CRISPR-associated endonuclease Csn1